MAGKFIERFARKLVPSVARLTYQQPFKFLLQVSDLPMRLAYPEARQLPPNPLRVRVGVRNRIVFNELYYFNVARNFWLNAIWSGLIKPDANIVDIGCGCGRFAHHLRDYSFGPDDRYTGTYTGIDIDEEAIRWCQQHFPPNFQFRCVSQQSTVYRSSSGPEEVSLPLADHSQDFVFSTSLFTHLLEEQMVSYMKEAARVLRPGGAMQMSFFCYDLLKEENLLGGRFTFRHQMGASYVENSKYPEAAVAYTRDFMMRTAEQCGFSRPTVFYPPSMGQHYLRCWR